MKNINGSIDGDLVILIAFVILFILFVGEPDLMDAIISNITCNK